MPATALIIDDEADIRELIAITLTRMGWDFHAAATLEEARNLLGLHPFDLCLTDMRLPDGNGIDFVKYVQKHKPHVPIAVITAHGNMEAAVDAMKNGAYDFVSKPVDISQLRQLVNQAIELKAGPDDNGSNEAVNIAANSNKTSVDNTKHSSTNVTAITNQFAPSTYNATKGADNLTDAILIGNSPLIHELQGLIQKVSRTNAPIWITGESGTGKEAIARSIHNQGPRSTEPFITVNCGAIPANQMEKELFGYKRDSVAGVTTDHDGYMLQANGGTLFLDEIEELPLQVQVKLLNAIQTRCVRPIGGIDEQLVNVRIVCASPTDLAAEVKAGRFRHDLYYRLNVIALHAPSLRERPDDIAMLVEYLLEQLSRSQSIQSIRVDKEALEKLTNYGYPGNVRELENILERASTLMDDGLIKACDINLPEDNNPKAHSTTIAAHPEQTDDAEYQRIVNALNKTHWNRKAAAELLGFTYRQLRYRIKQLGIDKAA